MKAVHQTITHWQAVDGKLFETREACLEHEANMSPAQRYVYRHNISQAQSKEEGLWEYGYHHRSTYTAYEAPGFLREGGEYEYEEETFVSLGFAQGRLENVLLLASKNPSWVTARDPQVLKRSLTKA